MKKENSKLHRVPPLKDVSRYTRWVDRMDKQGTKLNLKSRKHTWLLVMAVLLLIFILSFILFPGSQPNYEAMEQQLIELNQQTDQAPVYRSLDMPVDTFEQLLKRKIHERISKEQ